MYEELKQGTRTVEEREKVLVLVRRRKADKEAEQEIQEEPQPIKQWEKPRRWQVY
ncbi:hypothetical protein ACFLUY_01625 [Chloroflexota bacterium]